MVLEAAKITCADSGPSGLDTEGWRRILISRDYGEVDADLRKVITDKKNFHYRNQRLVLGFSTLNKNPGG